MNNPPVVTVLLGIAALGCLTLAGAKWRALRVDRARSLVLREYAIAATAIGVAFALDLPFVAGPLNWITPNLSLLANSLFGIVCLTGCQTILVASTYEPARIGAAAPAGESSRARGIIRRWWIACAALVVVRAGLFLGTAHTSRQLQTDYLAHNYATNPLLAVSATVRLLWLTLVFGNMLRGYVRYLVREPSCPTRLGLMLHALAGFIGLGYVGYEVAYVVQLWRHHPLPGTERVVGLVMQLCIVATVLLAALILNFAPTYLSCRKYRAIKPLWRLVAANRAGAILEDKRFTPEERLIRRRQENIDGLARLRRHFDPRIWHDTYAQATQAGRGARRSEVDADVATIVAALGHDKAEPVTSTDNLRTLPGGLSEPDLGWQISASRRIRFSPYRRYQTSPRDTVKLG